MSLVRNSLIAASLATAGMAIPTGEAVAATNTVKMPILAIAEPVSQVAARRPPPRKRKAAKRRRTAATVARRGPHAGMRVARGSKSAVTRFPVGTDLTGRRAICLNRGEQITIMGRRGKPRIVYAGPGCNKQLVRGRKRNRGGVSRG